MKAVKIIKRIIIYFLLITGVFLLQTSFFPFLTGGNICPNLLLILISALGFIYGSFTGMLCGLYAGLLMDAGGNVPIGFYMLIFVVIGFINGLFTNYYYDDYLTLPLILTLISELIYNACLIVLRVLTLGSLDMKYSLIKIVVPEIMLSFLITLLLYRVILLINRSLDQKEDKRGQNVA